MYTRPGTGGGGFNDGSSYASSSHYSGLPPGHGLPHGLPVTLSAHSSISGANRVVDALASGTVKEQRLARGPRLSSPQMCRGHFESKTGPRRAGIRSKGSAHHSSGPTWSSLLRLGRSGETCHRTLTGPFSSPTSASSSEIPSEIHRPSRFFRSPSTRDRPCHAGSPRALRP